MITSNLCDYHIHTRYSSDSSEEPENIIRHAINEGLAEICFTDHMDLDYPETSVSSRILRSVTKPLPVLSRLTL